LLDQLGRGVARRDLDRERVVQQAVRPACGSRPRTWPRQQVLALLRQHGQHATDVADEPHVEHAVGFVEHQATYLRQVDHPLVDVIEQAARRRDDDVHALAQRIDLRTRADTTEDQQRALVQVTAEIVERLADLGRELARRHQHQQPRRARATRIRHLFRSSAAATAARTRRSCRCPSGSGQQVATLENGRNGALLDGGRGDVSQFLDGAQQFGREAELIKRHFHTIALLPRKREPDEASLIQ